MDLQKRKLIAIEYLADLNDEQVFREIAILINVETFARIR